MTDGAESFQTAFNVSRETIERLEVFESLLIRWNPAINLVSKATLSQIWDRHFTDSAQIWKLRPESARSWLDLGSGAGFPGLIIAAARPHGHVTMIESVGKKCAFLRAAIDAAGLSATVRQERVESLGPTPADIVTARAFAPLPKLLDYAAPWLESGATGLFLKGERWKEELTEARQRWNFACEAIPSRVGGSGRLLIVRELRRDRQ